MGRTSVAVKSRYNNKVYDSILLRVRKSQLTRDEIKSAAESAGKSLNAYILDAVMRQMGRV